jgi:hypothetical protein
MTESRVPSAVNQERKPAALYDTEPKDAAVTVTGDTRIVTAALCSSGLLSFKLRDTACPLRPGVLPRM